MRETYFRHGGFSPCVSQLWWLPHLLARWSQHISIGSSSLTEIWILELEDTVALVTAIAFLDTDPWFFFFILILDPWSRKVLASMIYILDTVALVTALAVLHMTPKLWIISGCLLAGVFVIISIFLLLLIFIITLNVLYIFCHNLSFILPCNLYYRVQYKNQLLPPDGKNHIFIQTQTQTKGGGIFFTLLSWAGQRWPNSFLSF